MSNGEDLREVITELRVASAELKVHVAGMGVRDIEDRGAMLKFDARISALERWKSRVQGQIALAYLLIGVVGTVLAGRVLNIH
jgi:hypothetical protein